MSLRIQNNIAAMNAHRQLTIADGGLGKSLERLSSGFRINRAADDAAGLAVSQRFRAEIASLKVAYRNTSEATAALQVAEGAIEQITDMLTRLKELATQAASANAGDDRDKIDAEADQLMEELEDIATSTKYAGKQMLTGQYGGREIDAVLSTIDTLTGVVGVDVNDAAAVAGTQYDLSYAAGALTLTDSVTLDSQTLDVSGFVMPTELGETNEVNFSAFGVKVSVNKDIGADLSALAGSSVVLGAANPNATFQVGAENAADNRLSISVGNFTTGAINDGSALTIDLSTLEGAQAALTDIDVAIDYVASQRGEIGAYQNRLSYAAVNISIAVENKQAAESVIRDVDMASEMTTFTKNQILLQAGTAMLAQANMAPQNILSLLG